MEPALGCDRMDRYHVFSTEDMVNWTDHGEIMNAATVRKHNGWGCDGFMWAPDCAYNRRIKSIISTSRTRPMLLIGIVPGGWE